MGRLPNKARRFAEDAQRGDADHRRRHGFTVFHFDLKPNLTRRDMTLGEAIRYLLRATGSRMTFWRCPIRGIRRLPATGCAHHSGHMMVHFSDLEDVTTAKKVLALDMLLTGIDLFRGLPNQAFDNKVETIRWLLKAPPSVSAEDWVNIIDRLDPKTRPCSEPTKPSCAFTYWAKIPYRPVPWRCRLGQGWMHRNAELDHDGIDTDHARRYGLRPLGRRLTRADGRVLQHRRR